MPSALVPSVSPAYDRVIRRALAKSVDERYQTAREFSQALNALAGAAGATAAADAPPDDSTRKFNAADMPTADTSAPPDSVASGLELEFWRSIKDSQEIDEFELYLIKFPSGVYAELAQRKVARLERASTAAAEEAATLNRQLEDQTRARCEAEEAARRAAEEKARLATQAEAQALRAAQLKREADDEAASRRAAAAAAEAAVAPVARPVAAPSANTQPAKKSPMAVPAILGVLAVAAAGAAYIVMQPKGPVEVSAPAPVTAPAKLEVVQPAAPTPPIPVAGERKPADKPGREVAKAAATPAPVAMPGIDAVSKAAASKAAADTAAAKAASDMSAAKSAAEEAAAKAAVAAAAAEQRAAAAEQRAAAVEKAAADRTAAEKAAADKALAERTAAEKVAAEKAQAAKGGAAPTVDADRLAARRAARAKELEWGFVGGRTRQRSTAEIEAILKDEGLVPGGTFKPAPAPQAAPAAVNTGEGRPDCTTFGARTRNINC
jgi:hypothetical protein